MRAASSLLWLSSVCACYAQDGSYQAEIKNWRQHREDRLKAGDGWLTVAGLFWLHDGLNTAGSRAVDPIQLPRGPAHIGDFELRGGKVTFTADPSAGVTLQGHPVTSALLRPDTQPGGPDQIKVDDFTLFVIHRGERYAVRLKDQDSGFRREFTGLHWFPVRDEYRVTARFIAYDQPHKIAVPNILGETEQEPTPGYVLFTLQGHEYRLDPVQEGDQLFFIFRDLTSGKETYGSGRFLYTDLPQNGAVILDFNKAYNPPCAFTPYATCPLPPKQNRLPVRIEAGELTYGHH